MAVPSEVQAQVKPLPESAWKKPTTVTGPIKETYPGAKYYMATTTELYDLHMYFARGEFAIHWPSKVWPLEDDTSQPFIHCALPVQLSNYRPPEGCDPPTIFVTGDAKGHVGVLGCNVDKQVWVSAKLERPLALTEAYAQEGNEVFIGVNYTDKRKQPQAGCLVWDTKKHTLTIREESPLKPKGKKTASAKVGRVVKN